MKCSIALSIHRPTIEQAMTIDDAISKFSKWRRRRTFKTPTLAAHAILVESDLQILKTCGQFGSMRARAANNIASFEVALRDAETTA